MLLGKEKTKNFPLVSVRRQRLITYVGELKKIVGVGLERKAQYR